MACYLPGKAYKGNTVVIGCGKTCDQVSGARSACDKADSDFSGGTGVCIGSVDKCLLMSGKDHGDVVLLI